MGDGAAGREVVSGRTAEPDLRWGETEETKKSIDSGNRETRKGEKQGEGGLRWAGA